MFTLGATSSPTSFVAVCCLPRYDVQPEDLGLVLRGNSLVSAYAIFVAEPLAAEWLTKQLPFGHGFAVQDVSKLPRVIKDIFTHAAMKGDR